jgi:hypothetical protein
MRRLLFCLFALSLALSLPARAEWYKGNTHTHTINSDGDSSPDAVARWYKENGYQFVVLTDHDFVTEVRGLNEVMAAEGRFLVLSGEEVSDQDKVTDVPVHLNAINLDKTLVPAGGASVVDVLQRNVDMINAGAGGCTINHPNFCWAFSAKEMAQVRNFNMFEIFNGHPTVNNAGGGGHISAEAIWDSLLVHGLRVSGVASDDAHGFKQWGQRYANPGRGWVMVRADRLDAAELVAALNRGDFYSSTGVTLKDVKSDGKSLSVAIEKPERSATEFSTTFIGARGVLAVSTDTTAVYRFKGGEGYVRAKVVDSNGRMAWTQPVWP